MRYQTPFWILEVHSEDFYTIPVLESDTDLEELITTTVAGLDDTSHVSLKGYGGDITRLNYFADGRNIDHFLSHSHKQLRKSDEGKRKAFDELATIGYSSDGEVVY